MAVSRARVRNLEVEKFGVKQQHLQNARNDLQELLLSEGVSLEQQKKNEKFNDLADFLNAQEVSL